MKLKFLLFLILALTCNTAFAQSFTRPFEESTGSNVHPTNTFTWTSETFGKREINSVGIHFSAETNEAVKVYLDSNLGATFDTVYATSDSVALTDWYWQPDNDVILEAGDNIRVTVDPGSGGEAFTIILKGEYR